MALITASDVSLGYDNHVIVTDLNFAVNTGDYRVFCSLGG